MYYDVNYIIYKMKFIGVQVFDDIVVLLLNYFRECYLIIQEIKIY